MRRWIAVWVVGLAFVAGCGGKTPGETNVPTTPPSSVALPVTIERTGGIAGMNQVLEISADGSWVYTDRRQNTTQRGTLTDAQRAQLLALVAKPEFVQQLLETERQRMPCADSFHYSISVGPTRGEFEDCGGDEQRPAVTAVIAAISEATPL